MARWKSQGTTKDQSGRILPSATVSVYLAGTTTAASVYTSVTSATAVNSVTSNSTDATYVFYTDCFDYDYDQTFKIIITRSGYTSVTYDNIPHGEIVLGTYTISTVKTVTTYVKIPKGVLYVKSGSGALTFNGPFEAGIYPVFSGFTAGVIFGAGAVREVYPQWFGATGDGATDDSVAFQSALNSGAGNTVVVPKGDYKITTTLTVTVTDATKPTNIGGVGKGSRLKWYGGNDTSFLNWKGSAGAGWYALTIIEKLYLINSNAATGLIGIQIGDSAVGVTAGLGNTLITLNRIENMDVAIKNIWESDEMTISENHFYAYNSYGVHLVSGIIKVINNHFQGGAATSWGIYSQGVVPTITGNTIQGEDINGVELRGSCFDLSNNYLESGPVAYSSTYAVKLTGAKAGKISGNLFTGFPGAYIIHADATTKNIQILSNYFGQSGGYAKALIAVVAGATGIEVLGPQLTDDGTVFTEGEITGVVSINIADTETIVPRVRTLNSSANMTGPVTQTMFAVTASSCHIVFITQGDEFYQATGIITVGEGSSTAELFKVSSTHANLQLAVSGLNVQAYQGEAVARTVKWRTLRIY